MAFDLYETPEYKVRGKKGVSEGWMPARVVPLWQ